MDERLSRDAIIAHLHERFEAWPAARAAWLGGSDASGRTDRHSDIDFQLIVADGQVEEAFERLHAALEELAPIELAHRLPEPTWHGFSQEFLRLAGSSPDHFVDFVALAESTPPEARFLEVERHGQPRALFDRGDWLAAPALDRAAHGERLRRRLEVLRTTFELFGPMVTRSVRRGLPVEAATFYTRFALAPLVELLRMRHDPARFDFGLRYLDRDLPPEAYAFVQELAFPRDAADCERLQAKARERFHAELAALAAGVWSLS